MDVALVRAEIEANHPAVRIMSSGETVEIYKEVGLPADVVDRFEVRQMSGSHGVGHTRMATESAVTTLGAHPFSTDEDQCLVHNGSLSNHNRLRQKLQQEGVKFETENDTEVGAAYFAEKMRKGASLDEALEAGITDLDGFYTFVCGTKGGFAVVRDPIACKPAVLAETDQYVAFGSEYRALVNLPGIKDARVWEPEPANRLFVGGVMTEFDLTSATLREMNSSLQDATSGAYSIVNPRGAHAIACGLKSEIDVTIAGSTGVLLRRHEPIGAGPREWLGWAGGC